ncbi:hypothetical protein Mal33_53580 [Rosistilla oblonga]|uniref:Uncharacterized protein n=1 Tax=Rosistilla oblonga TaxID=2527990 RepID=A0A518J1W7_9BACT|nr:hypothetical protein Mal33_53580 [Rosistilla oblonga]
MCSKEKAKCYDSVSPIGGSMQSAIGFPSSVSVSLGDGQATIAR